MTLCFTAWIHNKEDFHAFAMVCLSAVVTKSKSLRRNGLLPSGGYNSQGQDESGGAYTDEDIVYERKQLVGMGIVGILSPPRYLF